MSENLEQRSASPAGGPSPSCVGARIFAGYPSGEKGGGEPAIARALADVLAFVAAVNIAARWVAKVGCGFHPDTHGEDYRPRLTGSEVEAYDRDMDQLFAHGGDPYSIARSSCSPIRPAARREARVGPGRAPATKKTNAIRSRSRR